MKLGLLTAAFPTLTLDEIADWASANGFEALEVACWPAGEGAARRYAGVCHVDVDALDEAKAREIVDGLARRGLVISALAYYPNPLAADPDARAAAQEHLRTVIAAAPKLGVDTVGTFVGRDRSRSLPDSLADFREAWPPLVAHAAEHGVRIAIENCPMIFSHDEWPAGHNIAWSPYIWRRILEEWGGTVGLNYDPSHLVWLMIDQGRFIREFGPHILHMQAKDVMIDRDGLYERGTLSSGIGWQVPRIPGLGDAPWPEIFSNLYRIGYDGPIIIEHEDRVFEGTDEKVKRGFLVARDQLRPFIR